jgi:hypothetical protein
MKPPIKPAKNRSGLSELGIRTRLERTVQKFDGTRLIKTTADSVDSTKKAAKEARTSNLKSPKANSTLKVKRPPAIAAAIA